MCQTSSNRKYYNCTVIYYSEWNVKPPDHSSTFFSPFCEYRSYTRMGMKGNLMLSGFFFFFHFSYPLMLNKISLFPQLSPVSPQSLQEHHQRAEMSTSFQQGMCVLYANTGSSFVLALTGSIGRFLYSCLNGINLGQQLLLSDWQCWLIVFHAKIKKNK